MSVVCVWELRLRLPAESADCRPVLVGSVAGLAQFSDFRGSPRGEVFNRGVERRHRPAAMISETDIPTAIPIRWQQGDGDVGGTEFFDRSANGVLDARRRFD